MLGGSSVLIIISFRLLFCLTKLCKNWSWASINLSIFITPPTHIAGGDSPTIDASALNEASVSYSEFLDKLNLGEVAFVEFLAPSGDAAYVTFKSNDESKGLKIRIGEGYPIEDPKGWSSPAFVVKAVAKKGVPYKFVVPGLSDSFKK